ncbi:hypothetical protein T05_9445 [Trichinella murrelli]|uniref:Uncharacterized protein n=1 Tax=Trichinella murrelli TaxID=144512 RepID=A0A0V0T7S6_9BILA|nr:hypothetical protein T05_9445 [Trichinella murrelli]
MFIAYEGGCNGVASTDLDVTTVIDLKDSTETCPVDEQLAYKLKKVVIRWETEVKMKVLKKLNLSQPSVSNKGTLFPMSKQH